MKTKRLEFTIDAPWELAVFAYDSKMYDIPNPNQPEVIDMKFFNFHWDESTDVATLNRASRVKFPVPGFLMRAITDEKWITLEFQETIDRKNRRIVTLMENKSLLSAVKLTETTTFMPDPTDPKNKTKMVTEARMNILGNFWGVGKVEGIVIKFYADGISKARKQDMPAIEKARAKIEAEGIPIEKLLTPSEDECREYMHEQAEKEAKLREAQDGGHLDDVDVSDDSDDEFYDAESDEGEGAEADVDVAAVMESVPIDSDAEPAAVAQAAAPAVKTKTKSPKSKLPKTKSLKTKSPKDKPANDGDAVTTSGGGDSPVVPPRRANKKAKRATATTADADAISVDSVGGGFSSEDGLLETKSDSDPEEMGKKKTRKQRMMGTFKKVGVSSLWAAGVALKATGRAAVVVKNKAAKGGAVVATAARKRGGTISKKLTKSKLKNEKRRARGSAYQASVETPYSWRDHVNTAEYETALLARRMQMETESFKASQGAATADEDGKYGMPTKEGQTEYDEIVAELNKLTEAKMAGGMPNLAESTDTTDTEALLGFLGETGSTPGSITPEQRLVYLGRFLNAIGVLYAEADKPEVAMGKERIAQLAKQIEEMSALSSALSPGIEATAPPAVEQEVASKNDTDDLEAWLGPDGGEADKPATTGDPVPTAVEPEVAAVADASAAPAPAPEPEVVAAAEETAEPAPEPEGSAADAEEGGDAAETANAVPEEPKEEAEQPKGQDFGNFGGNVNITVAKKKGKKKKK